MSKQLGELLRDLRENKLKCSQLDVAQRLNIDRSTYTNYELGKTEPSFETLFRLCQIFEVRADVLISDEQIERYLAQQVSRRVPVRLPRNEELILELLWNSKSSLNAKELAELSESRIAKPSYAKVLAESILKKGFIKKKNHRYYPLVTRNDYHCLVQIISDYAHKLDEIDSLELLLQII